MAERILTTRELNRATLARQLLLDPHGLQRNSGNVEKKLGPGD